MLLNLPKLVKLKIKEKDLFYNFIIRNKIQINITDNNDDYVIFYINDKDYLKLSKYYHSEIIKDNKIDISLFIKKYILKIINIVWILFLFINISHTIIKVEVETDNVELNKMLIKSLDNYGIKRFNKKKSYNEVSLIKNKILKEYNNYIEWLEIEDKGMNYIIHVVPKKIIKPEINSDKCHVIANMDGVIKKVIAETGEVLVNPNTYVHKGDVLISGSIKLNEDVKKEVCAQGKVYAEEWYKVDISIPSTYEEKEYTHKVRYNLLFSYGNKDHYLIKYKKNNYDLENIKIISLFNHALYLVKENEYQYVNKSYNNLDNYINNLVISKLKLSLNDNEKILYQNVLHKEEFNSRIKEELFVSVLKLISEQVTY